MTSCDLAAQIGFDEGYILAPGERFSVALFNNASCVAFELPGEPTATLSQTLYGADIRTHTQALTS